MKVGDKVYWRTRVRYSIRTLSGEIERLENDIATIRLTTKGAAGKRINKHVDALTLKKKQ